MMIDAPPAERLQVAVVAESDGLETAAVAVTGALRRAGISSEAIVAGSPRKRFDKALKLNPTQIYSLSYRNGLLNKSQRGAGAPKADLDRVSAIADEIVGSLA
jgi:histidyl-tRNA synthetase